MLCCFERDGFEKFGFSETCNVHDIIQPSRQRHRRVDVSCIVPKNVSGMKIIRFISLKFENFPHKTTFYSLLLIAKTYLRKVSFNRTKPCPSYPVRTKKVLNLVRKATMTFEKKKNDSGQTFLFFAKRKKNTISQTGYFPFFLLKFFSSISNYFFMSVFFRQNDFLS